MNNVQLHLQATNHPLQSGAVSQYQIKGRLHSPHIMPFKLPFFGQEEPKSVLDLGDCISPPSVLNDNGALQPNPQLFPNANSFMDEVEMPDVLETNNSPVLDQDQLDSFLLNSEEICSTLTLSQSLENLLVCLDENYETPNSVVSQSSSALCTTIDSGYSFEEVEFSLDGNFDYGNLNESDPSFHEPRGNNDLLMDEDYSTPEDGTDVLNKQGRSSSYESPREANDGVLDICSEMFSNALLEQSDIPTLQVCGHQSPKSIVDQIVPITFETKQTSNYVIAPRNIEEGNFQADIHARNGFQGSDFYGAEDACEELKPVQYLLACAEALARRDVRRAALLLQQLQPMSSPYGTSLQRVIACFLEGLTSRLELLGSPNPFSLPTNKDLLDKQRREGFLLMYETCPFISFGHFIGNSVILDAAEKAEVVHIVDFGLEVGFQWFSLIQSLASRQRCPPRLLRITGVGSSLEKMEEVRKELQKIASSCKVALEFQAVIHPLESLHKSTLRLRDGETIIVNNVLSLHTLVKENSEALNAALHFIHQLHPKVVTLVEQDANHNGPLFLHRFMESLYYYSAIFDSLDATMPRYSTRRVKIEQFHFAEEIKNIVSCEGSARFERHERAVQWRTRMRHAGFRGFPLKLLHQARVWLSQYTCDGYTLMEEQGSLMLGWKEKPIIAASAWIP